MITLEALEREIATCPGCGAWCIQDAEPCGTCGDQAVTFRRLPEPERERTRCCQAWLAVPGRDTLHRGGCVMAGM